MNISFLPLVRLLLTRLYKPGKPDASLKRHLCVRQNNCTDSTIKAFVFTIQGEFVPREYTDRNGVPRLALDVQVDKFQFIGNKSAAPTGVAAGSADADVLGDLEEHPF